MHGFVEVSLYFLCVMYVTRKVKFGLGAIVFGEVVITNASHQHLYLRGLEW